MRLRWEAILLKLLKVVLKCLHTECQSALLSNTLLTNAGNISTCWNGKLKPLLFPTFSWTPLHITSDGKLRERFSACRIPFIAHIGIRFFFFLFPPLLSIHGLNLSSTTMHGFQRKMDSRSRRSSLEEDERAANTVVHQVRDERNLSFGWQL